MRATSRTVTYDVVRDWRRAPEVVKAFFRFGIGVVFVTVIVMALLIGNHDKKQELNNKAQICGKPVIRVDGK